VNEMEKNEEIKKYFTEFTGKRFNLSLAKIFDSTFNFTSLLEKIYSLSKELGISTDEIKKIIKSDNPVAHLAAKIGKSNKNINENYVKSYSILRKILSEKDISTIVGKGEFEDNNTENLSVLGKRSLKKKRKVINHVF